MEYLEESLDEWLGDELEAFGEDDYVVFDCPGQIELYTNTSVFRSFVRFLQAAGWQASNKRLTSVPAITISSALIVWSFWLVVSTTSCEDDRAQPRCVICELNSRLSSCSGSYTDCL